MDDLQSASARKHPINSGRSVANASELLAALREAHRQIDSASSDLEALSAAGAPDPAQFGIARLRIGQAHLARSHLAQKIYTALVSTLSAEEVEPVRELQRRDGELAQELSNHIRRWNPTTVREGWEAYVEASRLIRARLRALVATERSVICPLLERLA